MEITAAMVKELREATGAGMMDCKNALKEVEGNMEKAIDLLREKGLGKAAKKADRLASEGLITVVINDDKVTISEINSETDFVAKNENFLNLTRCTTEHIQNKDIQNLDELMASDIDGEKFENYLSTQIATIGENLIIRRFETLKTRPNYVTNGYLHSNGRVGVIIGAECENEEVAKKAKEFIRSLCMHAAAMKPEFISYKDLDPEFVEKETIALKAELEKENEELARLKKPLHNIPKFASRIQISDEVLAAEKAALEAELKAEGKPEKIWDKIIPGKMDRFLADNTVLDQRLTLLSQFFVMDDKKTVEQVIEEKSKEFGGKITITDYFRFEVGEGLEKKVDDFAAEVAAQIG